MVYTVSKLTDYSAAALDRASAELLSALGDEAGTVKNESEWKIFRDRWMARKNGILSTVNDLWLKKAPAASKRDGAVLLSSLVRKRYVDHSGASFACAASRTCFPCASQTVRAGKHKFKKCPVLLPNSMGLKKTKRNG